MKRSALFTLLFLLLGSFASFGENALAPDFTLLSTGGEKITLSKLTGKVVLINFYGENCPPCKEEIPVLNQWQKKYAPHLVILGVDVYSATSEEGIKIRKTMGVEFISLVDAKKRVQTAYGVYAVPSSFLVDADGEIVKSVIEGITGEKVKDVEEIIKSLTQEVKDRKMALHLSILPFINRTEKARKGKLAEKLTGSVIEFLKKQKGIVLSEKPVLRIEGAVSQFTDEAGVSIKIVEASSGEVLSAISTLVPVNGDYSSIQYELLEKLKSVSVH